MKFFIPILFFLYSKLSAQDGLCLPEGLFAEHGNSRIDLEWNSIEGSDANINLLFQCFEFCGIPGNTVIEHSSDSGNGGWFRNNVGQPFCAWGFLCDLSGGPQDGFSAVAWSGTENTDLQSRMIYGPFETPSDYNLTLSFLELYWDQWLGVNDNHVEVSIDNGLTWESMYTSIPTYAEAGVWTEETIDLTNYSGQTILISFTFNAIGISENWAIEQISLDANNIDIEDQSLTGIWKLAPEAGAMKVGPNPGSGEWWSNSVEDVQVRACFFDDLYQFNDDGSFQNILGEETWIEIWQDNLSNYGVCDMPIEPHDGSIPATWNFDEEQNLLTLNGLGSYLGIPKAVNGAELPDVDVPESRIYGVDLDNNIMTISIEVGGPYWTFKLIPYEIQTQNIQLVTPQIETNSKGRNQRLWTSKEEYNNLSEKERSLTDPRRVGIPNFAIRAGGSFNVLDRPRDCDDPENNTEITINCTAGEWPSEITWSLQDSISGEIIIEGIAPFDTALCLINGWYNLIAVDTFGDGWNGAILTVSDNSGSQLLNLNNVTGYGGTFPFYAGPIYGCTNQFAENFNPNANTDDGSCELLPCDFNRTLFYFNPGLWASEVSWLISDSLGNMITNGVANEFKRLCLEDGEYKAIGYDSYGDGWNGGTLFAFDTTFNPILSFSFTDGFEDSATFTVGPVYGCMDINADNYDPLATIDDGSCEYLDCFDNIGYITYLNGDSVNFTTSNSYSFTGLNNGTEYQIGVSAVYAEGLSEITSMTSVPWNNVIFDPLILEMDTITNNNFLHGNLNFSVDFSYLYTTQYRITNEYMPSIDYNENLIYAGFNETNFTSFFDPSGLFGGLWQIGNEENASSDFFEFDESPDSTTFSWINDDAIGAGGGSESAYLITEPITITPGEKVFISMDLFFPQSFGSCSDGAINGEGFSEDLFLMISDDYGDSWVIIDSTMGGYNYWNTHVYDISHHLNGISSFIAALYYTDCNGNWALGVGVDNFVIKVADPDETIFINPMSGWIDAGEELSIDVKIFNDNQSFNDTELQLEAAFESLSIPLRYGISLSNEDRVDVITSNQFKLHQNYPNPFNPSTSIDFTVPQKSNLRISIYDILGREVKELFNGVKESGDHTIRWNGMDNSSKVVGTGMYFYVLETDNFRVAKKMAFLK